MLFLLIGIFAVVSVTMLLLDLKTGWTGESYDVPGARVFIDNRLSDVSVVQEVSIPETIEKKKRKDVGTRISQFDSYFARLGLDMDEIAWKQV